MKASRFAGLVLSAALAAPAGALACGDGYDTGMKMTHSGTVQSVDTAANTFTIQHAGSDRPITFHAQSLMLVGLTPDTSWVTVRYLQTGNSLEAVEIIR